MSCDVEHVAPAIYLSRCAKIRSSHRSWAVSGSESVSESDGLTSRTEGTVMGVPDDVAVGGGAKSFEPPGYHSLRNLEFSSSVQVAVCAHVHPNVAQNSHDDSMPCCIESKRRYHDPL